MATHIILPAGNAELFLLVNQTESQLGSYQSLGMYSACVAAAEYMLALNHTS